jgi:hypothetical protein
MMILENIVKMQYFSVQTHVNGNTIHMLPFARE